MDLNKDIVTFVIEDYAGNELGRYETLEELEDDMDKIVANDKEVKQAKAYLAMVDKYLYDPEIIESAEEAIIQLETLVREELFLYGLNKDNEEVGIQFL